MDIISGSSGGVLGKGEDINWKVKHLKHLKLNNNNYWGKPKQAPH